MSGASFDKSVLMEADFSRCSLAGASFRGCDLGASVFDGADLRKTDFRQAFGYSINPLRSKLSGAHFDLPQAVGLLSFLGIRLD